MAERTRRSWSRVVLLMTLLLAAPGGSPASTDIDGDGLEEIGVFGIEEGGAGRGPWLQLYKGNGQRVSGFFLDPALTDVALRRLDTNGNGRDEILAVTAAPDTQPVLMILGPGGAVRASTPVAEVGALDLELLALQIDGTPAQEIGVTYREPVPGGGADPLAAPGAGILQVLRRNTTVNGGLELLATHELIAAGNVDHAWRVGDFDGDAMDEVVAAYAQPPPLAAAAQPSRGGFARIVRPMGGQVLTEIVAAPTAFEAAQWAVGDFVGADPGVELLAGVRRRSDGTGFFRVFSDNSPSSAGSGAVTPPLVAREATPRGAGEMTWLAIRGPREQTPPGETPAPVRHSAFVGYRQADGAWAYRVWSTAPTPSVGEPPAPEPQAAGVGGSQPGPGEGGDDLPLDALGGGVALDSTVTVNAWMVGETDGDTTNGDGIVIVFTRGDRSLGFQHWSRAGHTRLGAAVLYNASFINPTAMLIEAVQRGRADLMVVARRVGGPPRLRLWNVTDPVARLIDRGVLGKDVR